MAYTAVKQDLVLDLIQTCILMLFNYHLELTVSEIQEKLCLQDDKVFNEAITALCKYEILILGNNVELGTTNDFHDMVRVNMNFTGRRKPINLQRKDYNTVAKELSLDEKQQEEMDKIVAMIETWVYDNQSKPKLQLDIKELKLRKKLVERIAKLCMNPGVNI